MIVTVDGPAGSGKSTAARGLAVQLQLAYLDTGAMYRAVTLRALEIGVDLDDADALGRLADECDVRIESDPDRPRVLLEGRDVGEAIRSMPVSQATGRVARVPAVRVALVAKQRALGEQLGGLVADGRDQGSVVFPHADYKFLLTASLEKRAERRYEEMTAGPNRDDVQYEDVLSNLGQRDATDSVQWAPLEASGSAIEVDTTDMTVSEVVGRMLEVIHTGPAPAAGRC